jgi:potassium-dependent mechanosensitive channel
LLKYLLYLFGFFIFLAIVSARAEAPAHPQPSKQQAAPLPGELSESDELGNLRASLARIKDSLERRNLAAAELQALREQISSLSESIGAAIQRLEPRLAAIKERLNQLGPKPDAKAPPEGPAVTAERISQQKTYNVISEAAKWSRLLAAEAEQARTSLDAEDLGRLQADLAQIKEHLAHPNLPAAELQALRDQINSLSQSLGAAVQRLEPRLAAIKDRLDQLGPKPDPKAPPEGPAAVAERTSQQKTYNDIGEAVKLAHALAVEAEQARTSLDAQDLGTLQAILAKVKEGLERRNLSSGELQALREQIDPLPDSISVVLQRLEPRLAATKDRLDKLGPKPDAKAPPESPAVVAERTSQQKIYGDISEAVSRTRLLAAEAEQARASIDADDLGTLQAALAKVKEGLARPNLTPADLQALREQIDPLSDSIDAVLQRQEPRLTAMKDRLDQLGPKSDAKALPESPIAAAERTNEQKIYSYLSEVVKRARALAAEAEQIRASITGTQRRLFTRTLFTQAASIVSPSLWINVIHEAPGTVNSVRSLFHDWFLGAKNRLEERQDLSLFWVSMAFICLGYVLITQLARRVLARSSTASEPSRFLKILGAWWVTLLVAVPPIAAVFLTGLVFEAFDLVNTAVRPFAEALGWSVVRIALAAGISRGLFAPTRPAWRLANPSDTISERIVRVAIVVASLVSITRLCEALNEIINASPAFSVVTRGVGATVAAVALGIGLSGFGGEAGNDHAAGHVTPSRDWFGLLRAVAWMVTAAVIGAVVIGYAAFGSFLIDQAVWISAVVSVLVMSMVLIDEGIAAGFRPSSRLGCWLGTIFGLRGKSLELAGIVLGGLTRLTLFVVALFLVLAPWGLQSSDVPIDIGALFFGFTIGGITISLSSVMIAVFIFGIAYAVMRAVQEWLDKRLLPHTALDPGLRNSITTSLGYIGFLAAIGLSFAYLGLSVQNLAIVAGALSVGIGFGLQSIVNNFVSGLILLWERAVRVGDWIVVGSDEGFVRRINVRSTEIETFDRAQVIIPNATLIGGVVKNLVRNDRTGKLVIPITIAATANPGKVREVLLDIAKSHDLVLKIPAPRVLLAKMSASELNFELHAFISDVETAVRVKSDLNFEIFEKFLAAGFFATPASAPEPAKIEIARIEVLEALLEPLSQLVRDPPRRRARNQ